MGTIQNRLRKKTAPLSGEEAAMKRHPRKLQLQKSETPISAMTDVVFLLLVYFVVTQSPIMENTLLAVNLPRDARNPNIVRNPSVLSIEVSRLSDDVEQDLDLYEINGQRMGFDSLKASLGRTGEFDPETTVLVTCGSDSMHQKLVKVLDACSHAGLDSVNVTSRK